MDAAIKNALSNRLDLVIARRNLEITDLNIKVGRNNTMPAVDFNLNYLASGSGGVQRSASGVIERGFGSVLGDAFGGEYPSWTVGVQVQYPIGQTRRDRAVHAGPGPEAAPGTDAARRRARSGAAGA